jgi:hypothetical protein
MSRYPRTGTQPETLVKILMTVIEKTPAGGATLDDLKDAYTEINDRRPSARTIYRIILKGFLAFYRSNDLWKTPLKRTGNFKPSALFKHNKLPSLPPR